MVETFDEANQEKILLKNLIKIIHKLAVTGKGLHSKNEKSECI